MTNADIIDKHDLTFDPGDVLNGSLYLCQGRGVDQTQVRDEIITQLRAAGLWSDTESKSVPDDHREAYKEQLQFIEAVNYTVAGHNVMIARFDHEKFPSDKARWDSWKNELDACYAHV